MGQILHTRNSGASVSDEEAERVQHTPTLDNWLIATTETYYYISVIAMKGVGGSTGYSSSILAPPLLHEIRIKSLWFPKVDLSFII